MSMRLGIGIGLGLSRRLSGSAWTPDSLFASGEAGGLYDPSDLSTLWTDTAGTTQVASDGDPVARMDDLSGNGNHWTQAAATARPLYRSAGGLHWLEFDGVDDYLFFTSSLLYSDAGAATTVMGLRGAAQADNYVFSEGSSSNSNPLYSTTATHETTGDTANFNVRDAAGGTPDRVRSNDVVFDNTAHVLTSKDNAKAVSFRRDGADSGGGSYTDTGLVLDRTALSCLLRTTAGLFFAGRVYGFIAVKRVLTASEIANAETWAAQRAGVALA